MLAPFSNDRHDGFYMVRVPFREDVKRYAFPPLDRVTTRTGEELREHHTIPSSEQQEAMDEFVDSLDLMDLDRPQGWFDTRHNYNPAIHGLKNAIKHRVLYPDSDELPPLPKETQRYLHTPQSLEARAANARRDGSAIFASRCSQDHKPVTEELGDQRKRTRVSSTSDSEATPDDASDGDSSRAANASNAFETRSDAILLRNSNSKIRYAHAVEDFEHLIEDAKHVSEACSAMQILLRHLVDSDDTRQRRYPLMTRALHAYRSAAATVRLLICVANFSSTSHWSITRASRPERDLTGSFIRDFRAHAERADPEFLTHVLSGRADLGLISATDDAAARSTVTPDEARAFVTL